MIICKSCKEEIADNSLFCPLCGYYLDGKGAPAPKSEPNNDGDDEENEDGEREED